VLAKPENNVINKRSSLFWGRICERMKKKFYNFDRPGAEEDTSEAEHQVWNYGWQRWNVSYK
jgi:hypothetical protein